MLFIGSLPTSSDQVVRHDLVLRSPYKIVDGIGTIQYMSQRHTLRASLILSQCLRIGEPQKHERIADISALKAASARRYEKVTVLAPPLKDGRSGPGETPVCGPHVSTKQTTRHLEACKAVDATITHAFHAAISTAVRD
ncbi:uncharacterized protein BCR38DRAFT_510055, partial [Pseudomassariella vexata]